MQREDEPLLTGRVHEPRSLFGRALLLVYNVLERSGVEASPDIRIRLACPVKGVGADGE
jgi:hypothetical protein